MKVKKIKIITIFFINYFKLNTLIIKKMSNTTEKTLHNTNVEEAKKNVSDIKVFGNGDLFQLICKASSESQGWMKSTKAMETPNGCVVQVTTQQKNPDGTYAIAEAITFVPGVKIKTEEINNTKYLG